MLTYLKVSSGKPNSLELEWLTRLNQELNNLKLIYGNLETIGVESKN